MARVVPFSLRPQAHEIIRTWAFYTVVKSELHFGELPWSDVFISGWGLAGEGMGTRLVTKLWNAARFCERFISGKGLLVKPEHLSGADRWILAALQKLVARCATAMESYEYAQVKSETEIFFWHVLTDNYLEMVKQRLYSGEGEVYEAACYTLQTVLGTLVKLLAPFLPYVTEAVYQDLFAGVEGCPSVHLAAWPETDPTLSDEQALGWGEKFEVVASAVRRYKTEGKLGLASVIMRVQLGTSDPALVAALRTAAADLAPVARAQIIEVADCLDPDLVVLYQDEVLSVGLQA